MQLIYVIKKENLSVSFIFHRVWFMETSKKILLKKKDEKNPKEAYGIMKYCGEKITEGLYDYIKLITQLSDLRLYMGQLI